MFAGWSEEGSCAVESNAWETERGSRESRGRGMINSRFRCDDVISTVATPASHFMRDGFEASRLRGAWRWTDLRRQKKD